jgi:hypothetical protein
MTANTDPVWGALGVTPLTKIDETVATIVASAKDDSAMADFNMARSNIHEVIQNGSNAIDRLAQIADASQHPRAFEVLATLLKVQLDANKDLMELQKKIREIQVADEPHNQDAKNVTNNLFVGSTSELQKMIENMKNGSNDQVV